MAQIKVKQLQDNFGNSFYPLTVTDSIVTEKDISYDSSVTYKAGDPIPAKIKLTDLLIKVISGLRKELDDLGETKSKEKIIEFITEEINKLNYTDQEVSGEFIYKVNETKGKISTFRKKLVGSDLPDVSIDKLIPGSTHQTIPSTLLPSYVDDVIEVNTFSDLPNPGESGKIYVTKDTNLTYRWSGTQYVEISKSLALGETSDTAYAGNKGKKVTDDLASEITRSTEKDTDLQNQVTTNKTSSETAISTLESKVDSEITRSTEKDNELSSSISDHVSNTSNPHSVTKTQIGLENVENKSSETIRSELTNTNVVNALGYTPADAATGGGNVYGPDSSISEHIVSFNGTTGKQIKDSGFTIGKSVPSDAKFTDTVYTHPSFTAKTSGLYKITVNGEGHVSAATLITPETWTFVDDNGVEFTKNVVVL